MNLFAYVKGKVSILDVINAYITVKKAGLYWKGHCPFHYEKTASFTVSPHREIFYCFGCHVGGDVISFVAKVENCTAREAIQLLIDKFGLVVPTGLLADDQTNKQEKNRYFDLCAMVAAWCHQHLKKSPLAMTYLLSRGLDAHALDAFEIGYFPGGATAFKHFIMHMQAQNILVADLLEAHIVMQGKTTLYCPFEERILFPIKDHLGRVCGFGGRVFKEHDDRAKYYNSRENDFFSKGSLLFGLDHAKASIQKQGTAFLVEGYLDCITMVNHGYQNTVATLGTACTLDQLKLLSRYTDTLLVVYDADKAGFDAIMRLTELCWQVNLELSVVSLPTGEDPASFLAKGNKLESKIQQAMDIFSFFIMSMAGSFESKSLNEKLLLVRRIVDIIARIDDPLKQDLLLHKAAKQLAIPYDSLKRELRPLLQRGHSVPKPTLAMPASMEKSLTKVEKKLFFAIVYKAQLLNSHIERYVIASLPALLATLAQRFIEASHNDSTYDFTTFFGTLTEQERNLVSTIMLEIEHEITPQECQQLVVHVQKKYWKSIVQDITTRLAQAQKLQDHATVEKLLTDFLQLKQNMLEKQNLKSGGAYEK